ncbi:hypothetical protein C8R44DRAFT_865632 [Mycena epipterygia]|nr:hypothetical protein C8R44DRAFT_865632 [Mycena epipterygia]
MRVLDSASEVFPDVQEVRIANYLKSYCATGRPPPPCLEYPTDPAARAGEAFASIATVPEYAHWSQDELRYYAYLRVMRAPPLGTNLYHFLSKPVAAPAVAAAGNAPGDGSGDQLVRTIGRLEGVATRVASIQPPPRMSGGGGRMPQIQYHSSLPDDTGFPASLIW